MTTRAAKSRTVWIAVVASTLLLVIVLGTRMQVRSAALAAATESPVVDWPRVDVSRAQIVDLRDEVWITGTTAAAQTARLQAEITARVLRVHVEVGDLVRAGSLLVELDEADSAAAYDLAVASRARAEAERVFADFDLAAKRALYDESTDRDFGITRVQLEEARRRAAAGVADVARAEADVARAVAQLQKTVILAPFTGLITARTVEPGQRAQPRIDLLRIDDLSVLEVNLALNERDVALLDRTARIRGIEVASRAEPVEGDLYSVSAAAGSDGLFTAQLRLVNAGRAMPTADEWDAAEPLAPGVGGAYLLRVAQERLAEHAVIRNGRRQDQRVLAGVSVRVPLPRKRLEGVLVVPEGAIARSPSDEAYVMVVVREVGTLDYFGPELRVRRERTRQVFVTVDRYVAGLAVIAAVDLGALGEGAPPDGRGVDLTTPDGRAIGLRAGAWVATTKAQSLSDGQTVIVNREAPDPAEAVASATPVAITPGAGRGS